ncbi:hypothetical protein GTR02_04005 [Kineococcus sp. R8]|uniref:hypothetical protein n=1 Tax=Kineococcus siccus TaxID=2696567 RepID=UPI001412D005|nr:hypothetical protein [Kineococcus siccus]NAZ80977.1 hypothetical protein [Kineococcus siccus]
MNFDLTAVVNPAAGGMVRLCLQDRCEHWDVAGRDTSTSFLTVKDLTSERSVEVSALVTDAAGVTAFDGRGTAELKHYPPEGAVCQEDLYRATVRAAVDGSLSTVT